MPVYDPCPLCSAPPLKVPADELARLRQHVENEVPEAILYLGDLYHLGNPRLSIVRNPKKAVKLWKRAVELGNVEAMNHLGTAYENGRGVKHTDVKKAQQLYRMGVDRGSARAQYSLANVMWKEIQSEIARFQETNSSDEYWIDATRASEIYRHCDLAAMQGHHGGFYMKGMCYVVGVGVGKDCVEARRFLERAAAITGRWQRRAIDGLARLDAAEATS